MPLKLLSWLPPSAAEFVYTVILKPKPLRAAAQFVVKRFIPTTLQVHGVKLALNQDDAIVSGALALGCYERFELDLFESMLAPGMCVVDIGANLGLYAAVAARKVLPGGRVFAIEPEERNCALIGKTIEFNRFTNLTVIRKAVSNVTSPGTLFLCADNKADHRIYDNRAERTRVHVEFTTLDDLVRECGIPAIDFMKVDIQGAELLAFEGMGQTLSNHPRIRILMELWPWGISQAGGDARTLLRGLREADFAIYELDGDTKRIAPVTDDERLTALSLERQHVNLLLQREGPGLWCPEDLPA